MRSDDRRIRTLCRNDSHTSTLGLFDGPLAGNDSANTDKKLEPRHLTPHGFYSRKEPNVVHIGPAPTMRVESTCRKTFGRYVVLVCLLSAFLLPQFWSDILSRTVKFFSQTTMEELCSQTEPIYGTVHSDLIDELDKLYESETYRLEAYKSLEGAIRIPTVTYDDLKEPGQDDRWKVYDNMHAFLASRFPYLHDALKVTKLNSYALVYEWEGYDKDLKPILLTAHQDVVPVNSETESQWIHPPFSGHFDGTYIWGRGSCDDKSGLIAIMSTVETLLQHNFSPRRTAVLAFGIDEERGGHLGAAPIGKYLLETYGKDRFALLVDEGGVNTISGSYSELYGAVFALPAVAEKGALDVRLELSASGGHSSIPPTHTSIGLLAKLITIIEDDPHPRELSREVTYYQGLQCFAKYGKSIPSHLRHLITDSLSDDRALKRLDEQLSRSGLAAEYQASVATTQAVDIIRGGVKVNALPESAYAVMNHRIMERSSVKEVEDRLIGVLSPFAEEYNLTFEAFGETVRSFTESSITRARLNLSEESKTLEPAPITPNNDIPGPWALISGTILATLQTSSRKPQEDIEAFVAPGVFIANTDTRHYWPLTRHIYRYSHQNPADKYNGAHTVNEAMKANGYIEMIRFFTRLILNADETQLFD